MKPFDDKHKRRWEVRVTAGAIKRVLDLLSVDLGRPLEGPDGAPNTITRLNTDPVFLVDVLFCVLKPQLDEAGVNDEGFAELLDGEVALAARDALLEDLADFFRQFGHLHVATAIEKMDAVRDEAVRRGVEALAGAGVTAAIEKELARISS